MSRNLRKYLNPDENRQILTKDDQIRIILEETNFDMIHRTMTFLGWGWLSNYNADDRTFTEHIPDVDELKVESKKYLERIWNQPEDDTDELQFLATGSGGLIAKKWVYKGLRMLELKFELTGWDFDYQDVQSTNYE